MSDIFKYSDKSYTTSIESSKLSNSIKDFSDISGNDFAKKLIGRDASITHSSEAMELIRGKVALVTGAGGSIGSEIVRQLLSLKAEKVYCIDNDEFSLYNLSLEIYGHALLTSDTLILADIKDKTSILRIFDQAKPNIVFHAAAHKYLPLLENCPAEAITTNVFGTENIVAACVEYNVDYFVNISTDKAANPSSVLGMTKRLAELCVAGYINHGKTKVASVRFGNVLGSRGSLIPTLMWQIKNEKPVMITDLEASRFFMTIPEASALVIEASAMATSGEIYILDMGNSVKIIDLIQRYVEISNCKMPTIVTTGLREGEKLHEELVSSTEIVMPTVHPQIMKVNVENSETLNSSDKKQLLSMVLYNRSPEELRNYLKKLIPVIERDKQIVRRSTKKLEHVLKS